MKIVQCHNFYRAPGGEDHVYRDEGWLLEQRGHQVIRFERDNHAIDDMSQWNLAKVTLWNSATYQEISDLLAEHRPDVIHFHNTFPLISPSVYYAARRQGVPVVQTLHNFRIICPGSTLLRNHQICEKCIKKTLAWPSVVHRCYRDSRKASLATAIATGVHRLRGTWRHCVSQYIALTNHSRDTFIASGLPADRISVKPNFVRPDPGEIASDSGSAVFVGRLSKEKGVDTLLAAWKELGDRFPLKIIGDGPMKDRVLEAQAANPAITFLGQVPFDQVLTEVGRARCLVCPSIWYETFGRSMIEAFATGTPVVASDIGSMKELVTHRRNGLHFRVGDARDLAGRIKIIFDDDAFFNQACQEARREFESKYTAERNYETLTQIYQAAVQGVTKAADEYRRDK